MAAPFKDYFYQPNLLYDFNPPDYPDLPSPKKPSTNWPPPSGPKLQNLPSGKQPTIDGYPWWIDPTFLNPPVAPAQPPIPPLPPGPSDFAGRSEDAPTNWLLSYYEQNRDRLHAPTNSATAGIGAPSGVAPPDNAGLLWLLQALRQQAAPAPDRDSDSASPDDTQQELPERRLGRRTCRC